MMNDSRSRVRAGVIGLGYIGQTHIKAYESARRDGWPVEVVAVCDPNEERRRGETEVSGNIDTGAARGPRLFDPELLCAYECADEIIADRNVELISICTHTETHADLAIRALDAGKHVLIEKPVAIRAADVERVAVAEARHPGLVLMPAMCMRFWPGWTWLKERVDDASFGAVKSAVFRRLGSRPTWATDFYFDLDRSGGAFIDLHIHDADFIRSLFGDPESVYATGSLAHVTTSYRFPAASGPEHVIAEGGWDHAPGFGFQMRYVVVFEDATAEFDIGASSRLTLVRDGRREPVEIDSHTGYELEIRHIIDVILSRGATPLRATIDDAIGVARLLEAERASLDSGCVVTLDR